jgi:hypothetical protein
MNAHASAATQRAAIEPSQGKASPNESVTIEFSPPSRTTSPMGKIGNGLIDTLRNFEETRSANRKAMNGVGVGPASSVDVAKSELLAGPASIRPASGGDGVGKPAEPLGFDQAVGAMTRSFDYAIETQLIVKTGSQLSSSASSLMRGQ